MYPYQLLIQSRNPSTTRFCETLWLFRQSLRKIIKSLGRRAHFCFAFAFAVASCPCIGGGAGKGGGEKLWIALRGQDPLHHENCLLNTPSSQFCKHIRTQERRMGTKLERWAKVRVSTFYIIQFFSEPLGSMLCSVKRRIILPTRI